MHKTAKKRRQTYGNGVILGSPDAIVVAARLAIGRSSIVVLTDSDLVDKYRRGVLNVGENRRIAGDGERPDRAAHAAITGICN